MHLHVPQYLAIFLLAELLVSLVEGFVVIAEGETGTFCAAIEEPAIKLDRYVIVQLSTQELNAQGSNMLVSFVMFISCLICLLYQ